ncbi:MAG TPA: Gfo/Idh/MocA family oxidoreductase [Candidatus Limnocylindrales bacterium]
MPTRRAAIIGLSWIGSDPPDPASDPALGSDMPISHAAAYARVDDVEVVAGCDIREEARTQFLERWRGRWPEVRAYADYREMLASERPDIVSIAVPDTLHREVALATIEVGVKAIYLEKPIATNPIDARAIIEAAERAGVTMTVNFGRRWDPRFVEARRAVRSGAIGPLATVILEFGGPRAILWRMHSHMIDLVCFFADAEPDWVIGDLETGYEDYGTEYRGDGGRTADLEPGANIYIAYTNHVRGIVTGWKAAAQEEVVHLIGSDGRIAIDSEGLRVISVERVNSSIPVPGLEGPSVRYLTPRYAYGGMEAAVRDLITEIETGRVTQSPPHEAWRTVAITDAVLRSQAAGRVPVSVERLRSD